MSQYMSRVYNKNKILIDDDFKNKIAEGFKQKILQEWDDIIKTSSYIVKENNADMYCVDTVIEL